MKRLMEKDANKRLGSSGAQEIKKHAWFKVSGPDVCTVHWSIHPQPPLHAVVLGSRGGKRWLMINANGGSCSIATCPCIGGNFA